MSGDDYKDWLELGHIDDSESNSCKICGLGFESFQAKDVRRSCADEKTSIERARERICYTYSKSSADNFPALEK